MATLSQSEIYTIAVLTGLPNPRVMAAVAMAESSGRTDVVNAIGCVGLWQINQPVHVKSHPTWTVAYLQNPINNALAAKVIYGQQGYSAWEAYTDGSYSKYLGNQVSNLGGSYQNGEIVNANWWDDFKKGFKNGWNMDPGQEGEDLKDKVVPDWMESIPEAIKHTADVLVNPRTWLRIGYGVTGVLLVAGGLFLMVQNTKSFNVAKAAVTKGAA
jgi:hypothetical protein